MIEKTFFTRQEIARELGIDDKTFRRYIKLYEIELKPGLIPRCKFEEIAKKFNMYKLTVIKPDNGTIFDISN